MNGKAFNIIKFKTMNDEKDEEGNLLNDSIRTTSVGKIYRKFSLDEFPQLVNVVKGDMSFIGPRPFFYEYMNIYTETEKRRHEVRPGITGYAQINGRNAITWKEKFKFDLFYVDNLSFRLDFKICLATIVKVIKKDSVNQSENMTMEKYDGSN